MQSTLTGSQHACSTNLFVKYQWSGHMHVSTWLCCAVVCDVCTWSPPWVLYTHLIHHVYTLCIYTTIYIFGGPPAISKTCPPTTTLCCAVVCDVCPRSTQRDILLDHPRDRRLPAHICAFRSSVSGLGVHLWTHGRWLIPEDRRERDASRAEGNLPAPSGCWRARGAHRLCDDYGWGTGRGHGKSPTAVQPRQQSSGAYTHAQELLVSVLNYVPLGYFDPTTTMFVNNKWTWSWPVLLFKPKYRHGKSQQPFNRGSKAVVRVHMHKYCWFRYWIKCLLDTLILQKLCLLTTHEHDHDQCFLFSRNIA